ncbi:ANTAR domain-containing protein [Cryptosporangium aurantiacum]|uniref:ANTAR domain-containing protein n=1 Tax=Cryptosporangium aurantiacum TaxID=134849 RepID=A0A1M7RNV8_9ACTN|nr:ANTAR domain-containing protein [Cryptosporangium aurantiacum]SHN48015.1 ANTAR domain-containing protein [Cryptosporangium aurantiacum]
MDDDTTSGRALIERLLCYAVDEVAGAIGAGVSLVRDGKITEVSAVGAAARLDRLQWEVGEGPVVRAHHTERSVLSDDLRADPEYPALRRSLTGTYVSGLPGTVGAVAMPGSWDEGGPSQFSLYLERKPSEKTVAVLDRIEPMVSHALATVVFCEKESMRADQMAKMVQYRRVIEQCKGALMATTGVSAPRAFELLDRASQRYNVRLRELAVALAEHVGNAPAEHPDDVGHVLTPTESARTAARQLWRAVARASKAENGH